MRLVHQKNKVIHDEVQVDDEERRLLQLQLILSQIKQKKKNIIQQMKNKMKINQ
jgi:hypothetical protein